jgi:hypothetical protein
MIVMLRTLVLKILVLRHENGGPSSALLCPAPVPMPVASLSVRHGRDEGVSQTKVTFCVPCLTPLSEV